MSAPDRIWIIPMTDWQDDAVYWNEGSWDTRKDGSEHEHEYIRADLAEYAGAAEEIEELNNRILYLRKSREWWIQYGRRRAQTERYEAFKAGIMLTVFLTFAALLLAAIIASPANAETSRSWGESSATITPGQGGPVAVIHARNELTFTAESTFAFMLELDGLAVLVRVEQGPNTVPDRYTVEPPEGFVAIPPFIELDEGTSGEILIFALDGMPMG